jgi:hypothetical protein
MSVSVPVRRGISLGTTAVPSLQNQNQMFNPVSAISAKGYARKGIETVGSSALGLNDDSLNQTQTRFYST